MARATMIFPHDFVWGSATTTRGNEIAAGHEVADHPVQVTPGDNPGDWQQQIEADLNLAAALGSTSHQFALAWPRVEPEPGYFDDDALNWYRQRLLAMDDRGIEPVLVLHQFQIPPWLVVKGGFNTTIAIDYFERYTARVVDALGDLVTRWITFHGPVRFMRRRYLDSPPPGASRRGWRAGYEALANLLACHAAAYHVIKEAQPASQVGVNQHMAVFQGVPGGRRLDRWWARRLERVFNEAFLENLKSGRLPRLARGRSDPALAGTMDFVGLVYDGQVQVRFPFVSEVGLFAPYPPGLFDLMARARRYQRPIFVTAGGWKRVDARTHPGLIVEHLHPIWKAINFCYPIMGYYHRSRAAPARSETDSSQAMGMVDAGKEAGEVRLPPGEQLYCEVRRRNGFGSELVARFSPQLARSMFPGQAPAG